MLFPLPGAPALLLFLPAPSARYPPPSQLCCHSSRGPSLTFLDQVGVSLVALPHLMGSFCSYFSFPLDCPLTCFYSS